MMSDQELLSHCYNSLTGEYGEIANTLLVETLKLRLAKPYVSQLKPTGYSTTTMTWQNGTPVVQLDSVKLNETSSQFVSEAQPSVSPAKLRSISNSPWYKE